MLSEIESYAIKKCEICVDRNKKPNAHPAGGQLSAFFTAP